MSDQIEKPGDVLIEGIRYNAHDPLEVKALQALKIHVARSKRELEARKLRNHKREDAELDAMGL